MNTSNKDALLYAIIGPDKIKTRMNDQISLLEEDYGISGNAARSLLVKNKWDLNNAKEDLEKCFGSGGIFKLLKFKANTSSVDPD